MPDRRILHVLPGGRSGSPLSPDRQGRPQAGPYSRDAGPSALVEGRGPAGSASTRGRVPGSRPGTRGRAGLQLLPPLPDAGRPDTQSAQGPTAVTGSASTGNADTQQDLDRIPGQDGQDGPSQDDPAAPGQHGQAGPGRDGQVGPGRDGQAGPRRDSVTPTAAGRHRRTAQRSETGLGHHAKREIRALRAAQLLSCAGDQFARVAIAVMVYGQTRSALLTSLVYALTYLPPLLGGPSVIRLTGRLSRRTLMICLDVARAALIAAIALPTGHLWIQGTLLFAATMLGSPFAAARAALLRDHAPASPGQITARTPTATRWIRLSTAPNQLRAGSIWSAQGIGTFGYQAGHALGFLAGAGLVAALQPRRTLLIDALTFLASAYLVARGVPRHQTPHAGPRTHSSPARPAIGTGRDASAGTGAGGVARGTALRALALLGWLAGFAVMPECLAAPYARALGGGTPTVGLLMAAMPAGAALGVLAFSRLIRSPAHGALLGWLAMLSCVPLIFSVLNPPLGTVLALWALAGLGTACQLGALAAFIRSPSGSHPSGSHPSGSRPVGAIARKGDPAEASGPAEAPGAIEAPGPAGAAGPAAADADRASAPAFAQAGLVAAQCLGLVMAGAAAQLLGPRAAVTLAGLCGLAASSAMTRLWRQAR